MCLSNHYKKLIWMVGVVLAMLVSAAPVLASEDGAYLVSRTTSYADPRTGETVDGGTQIALGDSMAASIVESQILIEKDNGSSYITMGLGLASNVDNIRIKVNDSAVSATITGSSSRDGDTVNHYRFPGKEGDLLTISMYVAPMGRDVTFFAQLGTDLTSGTGVYYSAVAEKLKQQSAQQETKKEETKKEETKKTDDSAASEKKEKDSDKEADKEKDASDDKKTTKAAYEDPLKDVQGLSKHIVSDKTETKSAASSNTVWFVVGGVIVVAAAAGGFFVYRKKKGGN